MSYRTPPKAATGPGLKDLDGRLLLVWPTEHVPTMATTYGDTEAIKVRVAELDGPDAGTIHDDCMWFGRAVVPSLKQCVGEVVLGRVGQGAAKPGQSPAWVLDDPTEADGKLADDFLATMTPAGPVSELV